MKNIFILFLLGFLGLYFLPLKGQDFNSYLKIAIENNPELKASEALYKASLEKIKQIGLEDPKLDVNIYTPAMQRFAGNHLFDINLMQMFPWFGTLKASRKEAKYMAEMELEKYIDKKNELIFQIKSIWYDYYKSKKEEEFLRKEFELISSLKNIMKVKLRIDSQGGQASSNSVKMSQSKESIATAGGMGKMNMGTMQKESSVSSVERDDMFSMDSMSGNMGGMNSMNNGSIFEEYLNFEIQIKDLEYKLENQKTYSSYLLFAFNALLNRDKETEIEISETKIEYPENPLVFIQNEDLENNSMVKMAFWDKKAKEAQKEMAKFMGRPMIGIGLSYMRFNQRKNAHGGEKMDMNMNHMFMPMISLSLPIYRKKYNAMQKEVEFLKQSTIYESENLKNTLASELKNLDFQYKANSRRYQLLQDQIKNILSLIRIKKKALEVEKASLEDLIKENQKLLSYEKELLEILIKGHKIVAMQNRIKSS